MAGKYKHIDQRMMIFLKPYTALNLLSMLNQVEHVLWENGADTFDISKCIQEYREQIEKRITPEHIEDATVDTEIIDLLRECNIRP
jgi:hypothetical protein